MGVDSNVLIFERIKEELAPGEAARAAVAAGFDRVFLTILDTHIASLIAAAFLFQFGTGPIRGFATTLTFGLLANVFTAVFVSRTMFEVVLSRGRATRLRIETFTRPSHRRRRLLPLAMACAGALDGGDPRGRQPGLARGGIPLGIDFSGGTVVTVKFAQPVSEEAIRNAIPGEETVQRYGDPADNEMLIRLPQIDAAIEGERSRRKSGRAVAALQAAGAPHVRGDGQRDGRSRDRRGPAAQGRVRDAGVDRGHHGLHRASVPAELRRRRHRGDVSRHPGDRVVARRSCGYDLSLNVVAAILTITGYSVNDTIVTFDRVRENLRAMPRPRWSRSSTPRSIRRWAARSSRPARRSSPSWRCSCSAATSCTGLRSRCWSASSAGPIRRSSSPERSRSCSAGDPAARLPVDGRSGRGLTSSSTLRNRLERAGSGSRRQT